MGRCHQEARHGPIRRFQWQYATGLRIPLQAVGVERALPQVKEGNVSLDDDATVTGDDTYYDMLQDDLIVDQGTNLSLGQQRA